MQFLPKNDCNGENLPLVDINHKFVHFVYYLAKMPKSFVYIARLQNEKWGR